MVYLKRYQRITDANNESEQGLLSPNVSIIDDTNSVNLITSTTGKFTCTFDGNGNATNIVEINS